MNYLLSQLEAGRKAIPCFFYPAARVRKLPLTRVLSDGPLQKELPAGIGESHQVARWCA